MQASGSVRIQNDEQDDVFSEASWSSPPRVNLDKNPILEEANKVSRKLQNGYSYIRVAQDVRSEMGFSVGCMIARMAEKEIVEDEALVLRTVREAFCPARLPLTGALPVNRRTVLEILRKNDLLVTHQSVRNMKPAGTTPSLAQVASIVEKRKGVSVEDMMAKKRSRDIVEARFITMWVLRHTSGLSLSAIGDHVGGRDHTSVINGISQVDLWRRKDPAMIDMTDSISDQADLAGIRANLDVLFRQISRRDTLRAM